MQIVDIVKMKEVNDYKKDRKYTNYEKMIDEKRYKDMLDGIRNKNMYKGLTVLAAYNAYNEMTNNKGLEDYDEIFEDNMAVNVVISKEASKNYQKAERYKDYFEEQEIKLSEYKGEANIIKYGYQLLKIWRGQKEKALEIEFFLPDRCANEIKKSLKEKYFGESNGNEDVEKVFNFCNFFYHIVH